MFYVFAEVSIFIGGGGLSLVFSSLYTFRKVKPPVSDDVLDMIVNDPEQLKKLVAFMQKEFSIENLMFYRVCLMELLVPVGLISLALCAGSEGVQ